MLSLALLLLPYGAQAWTCHHLGVQVFGRDLLPTQMKQGVDCTEELCKSSEFNQSMAAHVLAESNNPAYWAGDAPLNQPSAVQATSTPTSKCRWENLGAQRSLSSAARGRRRRSRLSRVSLPKR